MEPTKELAQALLDGKVRQARRMPLEVKLIAGAELFDYACEISRAGIRSLHPNATEDQVRALLDERLRLVRRLEGLP